MLAPEVIRKKRDGHSLSSDEIAFMVGGMEDLAPSDRRPLRSA